MARQRYYGEKFKPTKGAFGNKSKYQKSLERQAELRKQIAEFEAKKANSDNKSTTDKVEKTNLDNATTATE
tara:strand:+ start:4577 stop:4789 length:213 start_codon:yes stop_codon:yes gene_type:complete